ncbi:unnamed protein product [Allacma fusca]|uniref:G-protein coupled receptors family 2 profile 2 domain-containing protein n=1 Tax=Allacma fusca TaxID=39272 RepID=A0A8J2K8K6_9HEXA|nr:unnamed protein product [Allacma fusca]
MGLSQEEPSEHLATDPITFQWCGNERNSQGENLDQLASRLIHIPENISEGQEKFVIRLKAGSISCPEGANSTELTLDLSRPISQKSSTYESEFSSSGYFRVGNYYYPPEGFCITSWTSSNVGVRVCGEVNIKGIWFYPECGATNPCLPKCCTMNMLMTYIPDEFPECLPKFNNSARVNPFLYTKEFQKDRHETPVYYYKHKLKGQIFEFVHAKTDIQDEQLYSVQKVCFRLKEDGTLLYLNHYDWIPVAPSNYCFEGIQLFNSSDIFQGKEGQYGFIVNYIPVSPRDAKAYPILYATAFLSASVFLLLTFLVYALLWQDQKIQGWIVMSHSATMFFMYGFSGTTNVFELLERSSDSTRTPLCIAFAALTHFFYLSNFCWLTVTCFSLYWTFRDISTINPNSRNHGLYFLYALFGWGLPFIFVTVSLILDKIYSYDLCNQVLVPKYGTEACFVYEGSFGPYVIYPVAVLLFLNALFFSVTARNFYSYQKNTKIARENASDTNKFFVLISKLFFVMGFTWIFEFIGWICGGTDRTWYWAIPDMINCLQAVAIFVIYVCKSTIAASLRKRYPILIPLLSVRSAIKSSFLTQETGSTELSTQKAEQGSQERRLNSFHAIIFILFFVFCGISHSTMRNMTTALLFSIVLVTAFAVANAESKGENLLRTARAIGFQRPKARPVASGGRRCGRGRNFNGGCIQGRSRG